MVQIKVSNIGSSFDAANAVANAKLKQFNNNVFQMVRLKKKGGSVSVGQADVLVLQQFQKGEWKWAHQPTSNDPRMTPDPRSGGPRREQWSQFWCMVNTNKVPTGYNASEKQLANESRTHMIQAMSHALTEMQSKPTHWGPRGVKMSMFSWGAGKNLSAEQQDAYKSDRALPGVYIKSIEIEAPQAEQGEKQHRLHVHFTMRIRHFSNIQLNSAGFQQVFKKLYNDYLRRRLSYPADDRILFQGESKPLLWAKLMPQPNSNVWLSRYATKQVGEGNELPPADQFNTNADRKLNSETTINDAP